MREESDFEVFAAAAWVKLVRGARLMGVDAHTAEDVSQTVLLNCYRHWNSIERPMAYASVCMAREVIKHRRVCRDLPITDVVSELDFDSARDQFSVLIEQVDVAEALQELSAPYRAVVVCAFYLDLSESATAYALNIAPGTVKSRKARALATLSRQTSLHTLGGNT